MKPILQLNARKQLSISSIGLFLVTLLLTLSSTAYSPATANLIDNPLVPKQEALFAQDYLQNLKDRNFDYTANYFSDTLKQELEGQTESEVTATLEASADAFPAGKLRSTELMGSEVNSINGVWYANFLFEYQSDQGWATAEIYIHRKEGSLLVDGFQIFPQVASLRERNAFKFWGQSPFHYLVLAAFCLVPMFIIFSLIVCIRTPIRKLKWLWILFILLGVSPITLSWATGFWEWSLLRVQLLGIVFSAGGEYNSTAFSVGIPLGAIAFWYKRKELLAAAHRPESLTL